MTDYGKQTVSHGCEDMPNPFRATIANPTEEQKAALAALFGWLPKVYTPEPEYDPETQYTSFTWEIEDSRLVRTWEVHDIPEPEPTIEERVDNLEQNVSDLVNGEV